MFACGRVCVYKLMYTLLLLHDEM